MPCRLNTTNTPCRLNAANTPCTSAQQEEVCRVHAVQTAPSILAQAQARPLPGEAELRKRTVYPNAAAAFYRAWGEERGIRHQLIIVTHGSLTRCEKKACSVTEWHKKSKHEKGKEE
ncbi:hypothetical protein AAFF_G00205530 [Aldrovandia affinis]|uniref:Uncharacterized protein n=1 Tax=Aldrovandia affinis TaxID=143900 RepID=A0AAD7W5Q3_9TELE|nr:hypothetical protein AAFF_G00205530 [Aldrovandia affinis]